MIEQRRVPMAEADAAAMAERTTSQKFLQLLAVWLCGACAKPRGITEDQLAEGASIVGAAKIVEEIVAGATTVAFA